METTPPPPPEEKPGTLPRNTSFVGTVDVGLALRETTPSYTAWYRELFIPARAESGNAVFGTLMGVAVSVNEPWFFTTAGLVLLMLVGPRWISSTYTLWNWTVLLGQIADRLFRGRDAVPKLLPFLVVNSWAIFTSFNANAFHHAKHFRELADRLQYSMVKFHLMNTLGHFVPPVLATAWFVSAFSSPRRSTTSFPEETRRAELHRDATCAWVKVADVRVASLAYHLVWALRVGGGLRLDHVYLKRPKHHWYVSWAVAAVTHLCVGFIVRDACLSYNDGSSSSASSLSASFFSSLWAQFASLLRHRLRRASFAGGLSAAAASSSSSSFVSAAAHNATTGVCGGDDDDVCPVGPAASLLRAWLAPSSSSGGDPH